MGIPNNGLDLYVHQKRAISEMKDGCVLCGGVGSGKSKTAIAYYFIENGGALPEYAAGDRYVPMPDPPRDLYIITTARKRDTKEWEGELVPFLLSTNPEVNLYSNKVVVDSWNNIGKYAEAKNAFFIFDEQRVVGSGSWVKSFLKIAKSNRWILLSATPGDTWTDYIPLFIANGFYKNRTEFAREHIVYDYRSKFPRVSRYLNTGKLMKLRREILVNMDFRRETVPHRIEVLVDYDVSTYKALIKTRFDAEKNKPVENAAELCYLLRRVANSGEDRRVKLLEILEDRPRAIIFYNFDYELDILRTLGYIGGTVVAEWNGHVHEAVPKAERWVYLVQYSAGCEGWNCIETDTVIFYSQNYSYKVMAQAAGRIDRMNTPFTDLYYYHMKSRSGIDLAISRALKEKKRFNEGKFVNSF